MKTRKMRDRWLAFLLMMAMVLTSQPVTALANTIVGIYESGKEQETEPSETSPAKDEEQPDDGVVRNIVTFEIAEGAKVSVGDEEIENQETAEAEDGTLVYVVEAEEGYEIDKILVDGKIPAQQNMGLDEDGNEVAIENEYIIEDIQTDETVVSVITKTAETEVDAQQESETAATEAEPETKLAAEETETDADAQPEQTESETTEAEPETEPAAEETETEADTQPEQTESETEAAETELETEADTQPEQTESETEAAETESETELETTAAETESETELETAAETESETELETTAAETELESETDVIEEEQGVSEATVFEVQTDDGKVVKLSAPEGAFPVPASEVTMTAEPLTEEQKAALEEQLVALAEADGMKVTEYVAYDINLWVDGEIIQPLLPVQVTFENVAVAEESKDIPEDMSAVETTGFQMDTDTNEFTSVAETTVADDATPEDAAVAVEVEHFTVTGTSFFQVDETNPNNYEFSMERIDDETQEDGESSSEEMVTFEVNVKSLKGIDEEKLTLVPSVVDGTEEAGESEAAEAEAVEGKAEGTPVEVPFQADGEEISEVANPTVLNVNESWKQKIQIPVSELEGVENPMLNVELMANNATVMTISSPFTTIDNGAIKGDISLDNMTSPVKINGNSTITVNGTYNGVIWIEGGNVTIQGKGTINANSQGSAIIVYNDAHLTLKGSVTIKGGTGTAINSSGVTAPIASKDKGTDSSGEGTPNGYDAIIARGSCTCGGGILLLDYSTLVMESGTIKGNKAAQGGGICAFRGTKVTIKGGTIRDNTATKYAGGGMYVAGAGNTINPTNGPVNITRNETKTVEDLGGGGIFLENRGTMTIQNAIITGNTANGMGGGVAGCLHGMVSLVDPDMAAIYSNTAYGTSMDKESGRGFIDNSDWKGWSGVTKDNARDYLVAGYSVISPNSLGGGKAHWTGVAVDFTNQSSSRSVDNVGTNLISVNGILGLTASNPGEIASAANNNNGNKVMIFGNKSGMHGGGIGTNGRMSFGQMSNEYVFATSKFSITAKKKMETVKGATEEKYITPVGYTFVLKKENGDIIATATSGKDGSINFSNLLTNVIDSGTTSKTYDVILTLEELKDESHPNIEFDGKTRTITLNIERTVTTKNESTEGGGNTVVTHTITDKIKSATVDGVPATVANNTVTLPESATFSNTPKVGALEITKQIQIAGDGKDKVKDVTFTFEVTGPDNYKKTITIKAGESKRLNDLVPGTYTIQEKDLPQIDGYTLHVSGEGTQTVTAGQVTNVTVTNTYTEKPHKTEVTPGDKKGVMVGSTIEYEITYENYKDKEAIVTITDKLDPGVDYVDGSAMIGNRIANAEEVNYQDHTLTWTIKNVPKYGDSGSSGTVSFKVTVNEKAVDYSKTGAADGIFVPGDGKVLNQASVKVDNDAEIKTEIVENPVPEKKETSPGEHQGVQPGQQITYEITWQNGYDEEATVTITDKLDPGVKFVSADNGGAEENGIVTWTIKAGPNAKGTVTLIVEVTEAAYEKHEVENQASVQVGNDSAVLTEKVENPVPEKTEETPGDDQLVGVGDTITYEIYWANTHDDARTVKITDTLDPNVEYIEGTASDEGKHEDGIITWEFTAEANTSGKVTFQVEVLESARKYGEKDAEGNDVYGKVENSADVTVVNDNTVHLGPVENPVPKKEERTPGEFQGVRPGNQITYDIYWENSNDTEAQVTITDTLDPGVKFVEAIDDHKSDATYDEARRTVTWEFTASANTKGKVSFTVEVLESAVDYATGGDGKVLNKATVQVGNSSVVTNEVENPTTEPHKMENAPGDKKGVQVGDEIMYTVTYENYKNEAATVTITDKLDPGLDYVDGSASDGGVYDAATHTITWTFKDVPARGEANSTGFVSFRTIVNESALDKDKKGSTDDNTDDIFVPGDEEVLNQASVQVGNDAEILTEIVENPVTEPDKNATKVEPGEGNHAEGQPTANDNGTPNDPSDDNYNDAVVQVGDVITYTIDWENYNDVTADVIITDKLDPGLDYVNGSASDGGVYDAATHTITWTLKDVPERSATGSSGSVSFRAMVNENAKSAGMVENSAKVKAGDNPTFSTKPVENPVPEKTESDPGPNIGVYPGEEITYEISWRNTHDEQAKVIITDVLDPGVEYIEAIGAHAEDAKLVTSASLNSGTGATDQNRQTVVWEFTAEPNTSGTVSFRVRVRESAVGYVPGSEDPNEDGKVVNRAQVQVGNSSAYTNEVENPTTNPHKTETSPGDKQGVLVGDQIDYMVTYENYKNETADVTITDKLDPGLDYMDGSASDGGVYDAATHTITWTFKDVPARGEDGCSGFVTFSATVNEQALDYGETGEADGIFTPGDGKVLNQASVKVGHDPEILTEIVENPVTEPEKDATAVTPAEGSGDIAVQPKEDGTFDDTVVQVGDTITYTIRWENYEETAATVTITDTLDWGLTYVEDSASDGGVYDAATRMITWTLENVPARGQAGSTGSVTFSATVNENATSAEKVVNDARVQVGNHAALSTKPVENPLPEKTETAPGADLGVYPGEQITYEIGWENTNEEAATVVITDDLDPGVKFVEVSGAHAADAKLTTNVTTGRESVVWTFTADANTKGTVVLTVEVLEDAVDYEEGGDGKVVNRAKVQVGNSSRYTNEVENPTTEPHKTELTPGDGEDVHVGDTIEYQVSYENYRNEPATVTITDRLDPGLTYVDGSASNGGAYDAATRTITWVLENVPARGQTGSTGVVTFRATVNEAAYDYGETGEADGIFVPGDDKVLNQASVRVGNDAAIDTEIVENPVGSEDVTIAVTKTLVYDDSEINAVDATFYVALFSDEARTKRVSDVKEITFRDASASTVEFSGLVPGETYYIGETDPDGVMIEAGELEDGTLYRADFNEGYEVVVQEADGTVTRHFSNYLERIPENRFYREGTLTVTKQLLDADGVPVSGEDQTFYAGVFDDAEHTTLSDKVERNIIPLTLDGTSSTSETVKVSIAPGETVTLYVTEVDESGKPVSTETGFLYTMVLDKVNVTITEEDNAGSVMITNRPYLPDGFYKDGKLTITKKLLGADGVEKSSNETFYAGIFADAAYTELAGNVSANIVGLSLGGNSSASDTVDVSFGEDETVTLYVTEVNEDGVPVQGSASFRYDVSVDGTIQTFNKDETTGSVTITNTEQGGSTTETEENFEEGGGSGSGVPENTKAVKTGDDTPIGLYLGLLLAAAALLIAAFALKRRKRS